MQAELTDHLGYDKGDPAGKGSGNSRNGSTPKTVATEVGDIALDQPRDRNSTFASALVPKGARRLGGLEDMIISLYAGGMTIRDIQHHLVHAGHRAVHETISKVTDAVAEEVTAWQTRPLEAFYPVIYLDALVVKVRDGAHVANRAAHIAVGVDMDGIKHVLGSGSKPPRARSSGPSVCAELANRGVKDVLIVCCDGLTGFPEAIEATWPQAMVQTCVVHLIRASMRFVSYTDRKAVAAMLRPIYTAADEDAALMALATFADSTSARSTPPRSRRGRTPGTGSPRSWRSGQPCARSSTPPTASSRLNYQLRKIIKNRGHFPNDAAAIKLLWLAIRTIEDKRARQRAKDRIVGGVPRDVEPLGDPSHRQVLHHDALQRPPQPAPRQLRPRLRRPRGVLAPHVTTPRAPIATHRDLEPGRTPAQRFVCQTADHRVTSRPFTAASVTPLVRLDNHTGQHCTVRFEPLPHDGKAEAVESSKSGQIRAAEASRRGSVRHVEVFPMSGVGTFILGRPRPQTNHRRAESAAKWATPSSGKSPFRLGELFPRWANRVIARDDGVSPRERPGQDEAADWPAAAWSVVIEGLRQEDAARIEAVMQDWPEPHRGSGGNPQERQVCFSDVTRVAVEVRLWEAVQRREIGPLLWNYTSRFRRRQRGWLASQAAGQPSDGVGRRLEAPEDAVLVYDADWEAWPEGHEGLSAERAQALVELAQGWGYAADALSLHEWMPRSADRDDVKMRRRIAGVALRGGGLSAEEREVARRIRREDGAWLRRTRSVAVRHRLFSGWKWVLREIDWWTCGLPAGSRGKEPRGAYQRSS
jgi:putative transposase